MTETHGKKAEDIKDMSFTITFSTDELKIITGAILRAPFLPAKQALDVLNKLLPAGTKL